MRKLERKLNYKKLPQIIKNFPKGKVLVIGDLMLDEFLWGNVERISPEAPVPVVKIKNGDRKLSLGGAANVAYNIKTLGGKVFLAGVIGDDVQGKYLLELTKKIALDCSGIIAEKGRPTTHKLRIIAHSQQIARLDRETEKNILPSSSKKLTDYIKKQIDNTDNVVISDYAKGLFSPKLLGEIFKILQSSKIPVLVDPTLKNIEYYSGATLAKPNLKEANQILAKAENMTSFEGRKKVVYELKKKFGWKNILLTCGEQGMILIENQTITDIPSLGKEVHDVTGAGDTVIGTVALALSAGASLKEASTLSNFTAGIVVGKLGTAGVTQEELLQTINQNIK